MFAESDSTKIPRWHSEWQSLHRKRSPSLEVNWRSQERLAWAINKGGFIHFIIYYINPNLFNYTIKQTCGYNHRSVFIIHHISQFYLQFPLVFFHIDNAVFSESDTFIFQQSLLFIPVWCCASCPVYHPVAGILSVILWHWQHFPHKTGIFVPADKGCNLTIAGYTACWYFFHHRQYFVYQFISQLCHSITFYSAI